MCWCRFGSLGERAAAAAALLRRPHGAGWPSGRRPPRAAAGVQPLQRPPTGTRPLVVLVTWLLVGRCFALSPSVSAAAPAAGAAGGARSSAPSGCARL